MEQEIIWPSYLENLYKSDKEVPKKDQDEREIFVIIRRGCDIDILQKNEVPDGQWREKHWGKRLKRYEGMNWQDIIKKETRPPCVYDFYNETEIDPFYGSEFKEEDIVEVDNYGNAND